MKPVRTSTGFIIGTILAILLTAAIWSSSPYAAVPAGQNPATTEPPYLNPIAIKFSPAGRRLYVVCQGGDSLLAVDPADVGSANKYDTLKAFDVPQLDRVYENGPYLHNGEVLTLEEIWTVLNNNDTHGVTSDMRKEQMNDLIEFLKTL